MDLQTIMHYISIEHDVVDVDMGKRLSDTDFHDEAMGKTSPCCNGIHLLWVLRGKQLLRHSTMMIGMAGLSSLGLNTHAIQWMELRERKETCTYIEHWEDSAIYPVIRDRWRDR